MIYFPGIKIYMQSCGIRIIVYMGHWKEW